MKLDLLLDGVPTLGAVVVQAAAAFARGPWHDEGPVTVVPVELPDGAWIELDGGLLGRLGLGVDGDRPALRMPAAAAWLVRGYLPAPEARPDGAATVLRFAPQPGVPAWMPLGGGRIGVRVAVD